MVAKSKSGISSTAHPNSTSSSRSPCSRRRAGPESYNAIKKMTNYYRIISIVFFVSWRAMHANKTFTTHVIFLPCPQMVARRSLAPYVKNVYNMTMLEPNTFKHELVSPIAANSTLYAPNHRHCSGRRNVSKEVFRFRTLRRKVLGVHIAISHAAIFNIWFGADGAVVESLG